MSNHHNHKPTDSSPVEAFHWDSSCSSPLERHSNALKLTFLWSHEMSLLLLSVQHLCTTPSFRVWSSKNTTLMRQRMWWCSRQEERGCYMWSERKLRGNQLKVGFIFRKCQRSRMRGRMCPLGKGGVGWHWRVRVIIPMRLLGHTCVVSRRRSCKRYKKWLYGGKQIDAVINPLAADGTLIFCFEQWPQANYCNGSIFNPDVELLAILSAEGVYVLYIFYLSLIISHHELLWM